MDEPLIFGYIVSIAKSRKRVTMDGQNGKDRTHIVNVCRNQ